MTGSTVSDPFILERRFRAPLGRVFAAWTEAEQLRRWFGPKGVSIPTATMDLRPGGSFHYCMRTPDGNEMWGKWCFEQVEAPHRLVSVVTFSDPDANETRAPWDPTWPLRTKSVFTFREEGGETVIRIEWAPHEATEQERRSFAAGHDSMRQGWTGTMDELEAYLTTDAGGIMTVIPYLNLNGRCAEALRFYEQALGAKVRMQMTFGESPMADKTPPEARGKIMHASFTIGDSTIMASDGMPGSTETLSGFSLSLPAKDAAEAERLFAALSDGGTVRMPLAETFWAVRFGMLTDRFGVPWMVNCEKPQTGH
jgi:uncharacterized glyoxalase superfamily protein PhnB/uncharacterized protein YndB with AHSA1/START domain